MPFLVQVGATVMCAHGGQAQATSPYPRVMLGGQPAVQWRLPGRSRVARCPASRGQWPVRYRNLYDGHHARDRIANAAADAVEPGSVRSDWHLGARISDAGSRAGDLIAGLPIEL